MGTQAPLDLAAEMAKLRAELDEMQKQRQEDTQTRLLEQIVQGLNNNKKKSWFDKPAKFEGKIGDAVENWLKGWERWIKHRGKQENSRSLTFTSSEN
jgi:hypothetical protein